MVGKTLLVQIGSTNLAAALWAFCALVPVPAGSTSGRTTKGGFSVKMIAKRTKRTKITILARLFGLFCNCEEILDSFVRAVIFDREAKILLRRKEQAKPGRGSLKLPVAVF
jgi:hypothetical protein